MSQRCRADLLYPSHCPALHPRRGPTLPTRLTGCGHATAIAISCLSGTRSAQGQAGRLLLFNVLVRGRGLLGFVFNAAAPAPEVLAVPGVRQASFCGTRLISTRRFCARRLASRCWRQDDFRRSPAPQNSSPAHRRYRASSRGPPPARFRELLIGSIVADAVGMACHHDQPAGFRLNAQQRVHQQLCRTRFQRRFAGIEQRHAIEADRLRPAQPA